MKSRHSGADGQLRRRRSKPSAAYGQSTSGRPANRSGEGARVGRPRRRDHGVTHAAMPETMERAHATMELHTPMPVGGRRSGLRMEYKLLLVLLCQACATAVKGAWGRGGGGGGSEKREREREEMKVREREYTISILCTVCRLIHPRGPLEVQSLSTRRTQTGPQCPETVRKSSSEWTSLSSAQLCQSDPPRGPEVVHLAFGGRTQTGPQCPETVRKSSAHWTRGGRFPDIEVRNSSSRRSQSGRLPDLVEGSDGRLCIG